MAEDDKKSLLSITSTAESPLTAVRVAIEHFGRIDVLCNIAGGFAMGTPVHETSDSMWQSMMDLNAMTVIRMARAVVPRYRQKMASCSRPHTRGTMVTVRNRCDPL